MEKNLLEGCVTIRSRMTELLMHTHARAPQIFKNDHTEPLRSTTITWLLDGI